MNTPAAKRRRVDAANATLRKPFQSPLLRRQPGAGDNNSPGSSNGTPELKSAKRSFQEVYSPSSPSVVKQPQAARPAQPGANARAHGKPASSSKSSPSVPGPSRAVTNRKTSLGPPNKSGATAVPGDNDDNPFLALARAHGTTAAGRDRDAIVKDLDRQLEMVRQAGEIEAASERSRPGEPVDQELRDLVAKWRGAGRVAAEELFETVKERVDNAGGPKAWKEMQQRQLEFYRGFDLDQPAAKSKDLDEESDPEYSQDVQAHLEGIERCDEVEGKSDEDDEPEFNMGHMLRSLNIDFSLLGYDEKEDKWVN